jgi:hypothetical protein
MWVVACYCARLRKGTAKERGTYAAMQKYYQDNFLRISKVANQKLAKEEGQL